MSKTSSAATPAAVENLNFVTPEQVADAIKAAGCAVTSTERDGITWLHSASHGIGFQVLWGNAAVPGQYADFSLSCPLRVQGGTLPENLLPEWHRTKRFARVAQHGDFVSLEMDVIVAGGISPANLAVSLQLWTQMMGQFFLYLRNFKSDTDTQATEAPAIATEAVTDTAIA